MTKQERLGEYVVIVIGLTLCAQQYKLSQFDFLHTYSVVAELGSRLPANNIYPLFTPHQTPREKSELS